MEAVKLAVIFHLKSEKCETEEEIFVYLIDEGIIYKDFFFKELTNYNG